MQCREIVRIGPTVVPEKIPAGIRAHLHQNVKPGSDRVANHLEMQQDVLAEAGLRRFTALDSL